MNNNKITLEELFDKWFREQFDYLPEEKINNAIIEGRKLSEEAGFYKKSPNDILIEQINNYNTYIIKLNNE